MFRCFCLQVSDQFFSDSSSGDNHIGEHEKFSINQNELGKEYEMSEEMHYLILRYLGKGSQCYQTGRSIVDAKLASRVKQLNCVGKLKAHA